MVVLQFLELLRAGLWKKDADTSLFQNSDVNWLSIYRLAQEQTVIGVVYDGILTLPAELHPDRKLFMQWTVQVARIEDANKLLDLVASEVFQLYENAALHPVLLKGQGIASLYPIPKHRQCGDLDIFLGKKENPIANNILLKNGGTTDEDEGPKHTGFEYKGARIENHLIVAKLHNPFSNRLLQRLINNNLPDDNRSVYLNEKEVHIPNPTFNAIYIFQHAFNHFLSSGIGLRHICDWSKVIAEQHQEIDAEAVKHFLQRTRLKKGALAFASVAVQYIGLDKKLLPFELNNRDYQLGKELLKEILKTGNFGKYDQRISQRPPGYWSGKWYSFRKAVKRCIKFGKFSFSEAFWYPLSLIQTNIAILFKKLYR